MEFRFHCFVVRHLTDRVTVIPLELPQFALHASSLERAVEDLTLALDDRITRAHPRKLAAFARPGGGQLIELEVPALRVWGTRETLVRPLRMSAVVAPAHKPFVEVRAVRPDLRIWLPAGDDLPARAAEMLKTHLARLPDDALLALKPEGAESLTEVVVHATPTRLRALRYRELDLDERPPPRPRERDEDDDDAARASDDEDATRREELLGGDELATGSDDAAGGEDPDGFDDDVGGGRRKKTAGVRRKKRVPTPTLDRIGVALHELARVDALDRAYELDALVARVLDRFEARHPDPLVLVGPAGVGKTALLHEVAARMAAPDAPPERRARKFVFVDASRLIAGEGFFGDWQQQTLDALDEARRANAVLHLGHAIELLDAGKSAHSDQNAAQLMAGILAAREVCVVAEATPEEWARLERRNLSFAQLWSVLRVDEPAPDVTQRILARVAEELGEGREVRVEPDAVSTAGALARRFWPYGSHLGNTVRFLRRLVDARAHARAWGSGGRGPAAGRGPQTPRVTGHDATELFSSESGIPPVLLRDDIPLDPATVRAFLRARVMGQDGAVERATEVVAVIKAGLADLRRPVAVLFFAGPTGVGKTELSKALAEFVFGSRERLVRLDMGEYAGPDALSRLIGDPGAPGHLTGAVRRQPFCVVLLDEIEKAHPAVFDALLGVLGEGRLTDAEGRFTDFRNAVIVMTSNLGSDTLRTRVGFDRGGGPGAVPPAGGGTPQDPREGEASSREVRQHYVSEAERFFRPELINRIDDFVVFAPLGPGVIRAIVTREVAMVSRREGLKRHEVALEVSDAALAHLAARGFDPRYGARPLKRAIERELVAPVGAYLATHARVAGATRLTVGADTDKPALVFRATTLGAGDDATGRAAAMEVLEDAAALRAEVRRWSRSQLARGLVRSVAMFDKLSRLPGFWNERGIADRTAAHAAAARAVLEGLAEVARQAEAAEDLAFEAYYDRAAQDLVSLRLELAAARRAFQPLQEQLYNTLYPPKTGVVLYLAPGRGSWSWALWLLRTYRKWCDQRELVTRTFTPLPAPESASGAKKRGTSPPPRDDGAPRPTWEANVVSDTVTWPVIALAIDGTTGGGQMLLASEHGAHRFTDGGSTSVVRVRFEPRFATRVEHLPSTEESLASMPDDEIRRVAPGKGVLKDVRTGTDHPLDSHSFDLPGVLAAWMRYRVFGSEAEPWS